MQRVEEDLYQQESKRQLEIVLSPVIKRVELEGVVDCPPTQLYAFSTVFKCNYCLII